MANKADEKIIAEARTRRKLCYESDYHNRVQAVDTLKFVLGENYCQWNTKEKQRRDDHGRVVLQINQLPKFAKQVSGDMRQNKIRAKVRPESKDADIETAKIREGIIRGIEYKSSAEAIYDYAADYNLKCGYGAWRILTKYNEENPFEQEAYLELIENPLTVWMDPRAKDLNYADAKYGFIIEEYTRDEFQQEFGADKMNGLFASVPQAGSADYLWWTEQTISVVEYFYVEPKKILKALLTDGQVMTKVEALKYIEDWKAEFARQRAEHPGELINDSMIPEIAKEREVTEHTVKWCKLTADEVLAKKEWPGSMIPIVLFHGECITIENKRFRHGLFHDSLDAQRSLNYWHTALAETVALQPKNPILITSTQIKGHEKEYARAHDDNLPFLLYEPDSRPGVTPVTRMPAGNVNPALFAQVEKAEANIKSTIGMFNADVGDVGRELSGVAIKARQTPGDVATFIYPDKLSQAIAHSARILNDIIPHLYDTERDARLQNEDGTESFVPINTTVGKASDAIAGSPDKYTGIDRDKLNDAMNNKDQGPNATYNDMQSGKYSVVVTTGPAYATRRMEAASQMIQMATALPNMQPLDKYYLVDKLDVDGSDEWAASIRKTIPYGILKPQPGEKPPPPPPPDPKLQVEIAKLEVQKLDRSVQIEKAQTERIRQRVALLDMLNKLKDSDTAARHEVMQALQEVRAEYDQNQPQPQVQPQAQARRQLPIQARQ